MTNLSGATTAVFIISLSAALEVPVNVAWETKDGTAKAGTDYEAASGSVTFEAGDTQKQIQVTVYGRETVDAATRKFSILLYPPENAILDQTLTEVEIQVTDSEGVSVTSLVVATGPRGLKGDPGLSAYELAKIHGYTGTLQEWLENQNPVAAMLQKTIRVSESSIPMLPDVEERKNKILAFDNNGSPMVTLPESGSAADVLIELRSSSGATKVYKNKSPLERIIRASIFEYLTEADQQTLMTSPGADLIADYALKQAIDEGVMVLDIPWNVGALNFGLDPATLPLGFQFIGWGCRRPYTIDGDNSFLNCGVVIRVAAGASFPFYSTGRHVFRDIVFDGRDKTTYLFYSPSTATQFNGTRLEGCGFYRFAIGVGWASGGTARYIGTVKAYFCSISGNGDGVRNLIDSMMFGCTINANDRGVALIGGANNNFFGGCRNEWNTGDNWYAYQSVENQIFGELCDRAGRGGVVAGAKSSWILNGVNVRRSGANQPVGNDYSANFIIIDDGKIELSGVRTGVGANDSGDGGTISPSYNVSALGSGGGTLLVSGSDMTGFVTSAINQKATTLNKSITGNLGMDDDVNIGMTQVVKGRRIIGSQSSGTLAGSAGATLSLTKTNISQNAYDTYVTRAILIECRIGSSGLGDDIKIPVRIRREGSYYIDVITAGIVASSGRIGISGTGVTVALSIDSATGLITVLLTNVDGQARTVNVSMLPSM